MKQNINNKQLIEKISAKTGISVEKTKELLETFVYVIEKEMRLKKKINLSGFGSFFAPKRAMKNEKGSYTVKTPRFKQFASFKDELNK